MVGETEGVGFRHLGSNTFELGRVAGELHIPAPSEVAVDPEFCCGVLDIVHRIEHGLLHSAIDGHGRKGRTPAAVSTRRTEPDVLGLKHSDTERWVGHGEMMSRPKAGETSTNDGNVNIEIGRERSPTRLRSH
jgi:hypothetical protein